MNDIDMIVRETLESYAAGTTLGADLTAGAVRRSRTIRRRRMATAGVVTVTVLGVGSFAAAAALGRIDQTVRDPRVQVGSSPSTNESPAPSPTPSSLFAAGCPTGQEPEVTEIGTATASGNIEGDQGAQPATQNVLQSYLRAVSNQEPVAAYGPGIDSASHSGVVWVTFQGGRTIEVVADSTNTAWLAYPARVGSCASG